MQAWKSQVLHLGFVALRQLQRARRTGVKGRNLDTRYDSILAWKADRFDPPCLAERCRGLVGCDRRHHGSHLESPSRRSFEGTPEGRGDLPRGFQAASLTPCTRCPCDQRRIKTCPGARCCRPTDERFRSQPLLFPL